eukprot:m.34277 g.34277  ORF g.34277 m.34277 type:complete len:288 (+) comp10671_c0_seq2:1-864(+)
MIFSGSRATNAMETSEPSEMDLEEQELLANVFEQIKNEPAFVSDTDVVGVRRTAAWLVAKHLRPVFDGNTLSEVVDAADEAAFNLRRLGVFRSVDLQLDTVGGKTKGKAEALRVLVDVQERNLFGLDAGTAVGQNEGSVRLNANILNPLGIADKFSFQSSRSTAGNTVFDLAYRVPIAGDPDLPFTLHMYKTSQDRPTSSHVQQVRGVAAEIEGRTIMGTHRLRYDIAVRDVTGLSDEVGRGSSTSGRGLTAHFCRLLLVSFLCFFGVFVLFLLSLGWLHLVFSIRA